MEKSLIKKSNPTFQTFRLSDSTALILWHTCTLYTAAASSSFNLFPFSATRGTPAELRRPGRGARILFKPKSLKMGKKVKNYSVSKSSKRGRKSNAEKNLKKKKKLRSQEKSLAKAETRDLKHKMKNMCNDFKMMSTTQAIVRQKLRRDEKKLKTDMKGICKDLERLLETKEEVDEGDKVEVAVVEDLACKVEHLMIGQEELARPGFVYTRWQQKKFLERLSLLRRRGEAASDENAASSQDLCCQSPNLCTMHSQNLFHDL